MIIISKLIEKFVIISHEINANEFDVNCDKIGKIETNISLLFFCFFNGNAIIYNLQR